jgi:hypothetical protein
MLEQQGFYYHPHKPSIPIGHPQLDFDLLAQPGNRSYNLKFAKFQIWDNDNLRYETLSNLTREPAGLQVSPGRFSLQTFDGQVLNGFSFGGRLELVHFPDFTRYHLTSTAPIGNLSDDPGSPQVIIIGELAALAARKRAGTTQELLARNLAAADPFQLFVASLAALDTRAKKLAAAAKTQQYRQMARLVNNAVQALKEAGEWPDPVPNLETLLR